MIADKWKDIKNYLSQGINLVATNSEKEPVAKWTRFQTERIDEKELFYQFEQNAAENCAFVLGKVSGNLFIIDVDSKYKAGFDAMFLSDIKELYPDLWSRLRIHKTPSGGCHIIYRTAFLTPMSKKIASRLMTDQEIIEYKLKHPKDRSKVFTKCFLETKGEGGITACNVNDGYSVLKDNPIPTLTEQEHDSLLALGSTYNEIIKIEKPFKPTVYQSSYYDENPFEHYNNSPEAEKVLENNGWLVAKHSTNFIWYTRPGGKKGDIHASFNRSKRVYFVFTTSTGLEPETGYNPSTALAHLQFNGDKKTTYSYLVESGYGKVKAAQEKATIKKLARSGIEPPKNFSEQAKQEFTEITTQLQTLHPHGIFWGTDEKNKTIISREALMVVSHKLGYRLYKNELHLIDGNKLHKQDERQYQDVLKAYIKEPAPNEFEDIANAFEAFMQKNGKYTMGRLTIIDPSHILNDTKDECYKFYNNEFICVTSKDISRAPYSDFPQNKFILAEKVQNRDFNLSCEGKYLEFLSRATNWKDQEDHISSIIGYLSHEFKDETTGFIIVLTEECPDPKDGGGSGKNLFCNLLSNTTTYHSKNGSQIKFDEKFFQSWNGQRIMGISDVPKNFPFEFLKEPSTGTFIQKKLFKDEREVGVYDGPKFIVQTNYSFEITDGGLKRRIIPLEFSDFFTKSGGIDSYFGVHFPLGWTKTDWNNYDTVIVGSIQKWLKNGRKLKSIELTQTGYEKQFEYSYGKQLTEFINDNFNSWVTQEKVFAETIKNSLKAFFNDNDTPIQYRPSKNKVSDAIKEMCKHKKIDLKTNQLISDGLIQKKGYIFTKPPENQSPY